jgi:8-oxo-dGTP pyrophosphatase MutT (NUDIX family)
MVKEWKKIRSKIVTKNRIFTLRENICISPKNDKEYSFFLLDTLDWVNIIPLTSEGKVIMIQQFRHGNEEITLEIPGGMTDKTDLNAREAAIREMIEETGYSSKEVIKIGKCSPNPAIFNNYLHVFAAKNVEKKFTQNLEGTEDIDVVEIDLTSIPELIQSGKINHALVIAAFYFYFNSV